MSHKNILACQGTQQKAIYYIYLSHMYVVTEWTNILVRLFVFYKNLQHLHISAKPNIYL